MIHRLLVAPALALKLLWNPHDITKSFKLAFKKIAVFFSHVGVLWVITGPFEGIPFKTL